MPQSFCSHILIIASLVLALAGCEKKEEAVYSRIPGLPDASEQPSAPPVTTASSSGAAGAVSAPSLSPGMPPASGAATSASAGAAIPPPPQTKILQGGNKLQVAGLAFTVPGDWKAVKSASSMRAAQYELPGEAGPAEAAVFYFGPGQGGSIEDNVRRWAGQFTSDDPTTSTIPADVGRMEKDDLRLALVKASGTYDPGSMGPMAPASSGPKPGHALFGLVVEGGPEGSLYIKVTGPKATMQAQNSSLEAFAQSVKVSSYK